MVFLHLVAKRQGEAALDLFRLEGVHLKGRHNRGVRLDGKQLLAVSKKADEHTAMDMSDLMKCLKIGHIYHCPDISILSRSVDTCVSAIYFKDLEGRREHVWATLPPSRRKGHEGGNEFLPGQHALPADLELQSDDDDPSRGAVRRHQGAADVHRLQCPITHPDTAQGSFHQGEGCEYRVRLADSGAEGA